MTCFFGKSTLSASAQACYITIMLPFKLLDQVYEAAVGNKTRYL